jgi:hypothetical protein
MADSLLENLPAFSGTLLGTDVFYIVVDPGGTPLDRYITVSQIAAGLDNFLTQYAYLPGRNGGQRLYGGSQAPDNLQLDSNSVFTGGQVSLDYKTLVAKHLAGSSDPGRGNVAIGADPSLGGASTAERVLQVYAGVGPETVAADSVGLYAKDYAAADSRLWVLSEAVSHLSATIIGNGGIILAKSLGAGGLLAGTDAASLGTLRLAGQWNTAQQSLIEARGALILSTFTTPAQITANQNDYSAGGWVNTWRLSTDAARTITGFTTAQEGRLIFLYNAGSFNIVLAHESASSLAAARLNLPGAVSFTVGAGETAVLRYDGTLSRWTLAASIGDVVSGGRAGGQTISGGTGGSDALRLNGLSSGGGFVCISGTLHKLGTQSHELYNATEANPVFVTKSNLGSPSYGDTKWYDNGGAGQINTIRARGDTGVLSAVRLQATQPDDGLSPLVVTSKTVVTNLNTDTCDAVHSSDLARGFLKGLRLSNNTTDPTNDIDVAPGCAYDTLDSIRGMMTLGSTITKRLDAAWAVGSGNGGLDTGTKAADTGYHVWLIYNQTSDITDVLFSLSATSPTLPTNYARGRRIGWIHNNASNAIQPFIQTGDDFWWLDPIRDVSTTTLGTTRTNFTLRVPTGFRIRVFANMTTTRAAAGVCVYVSNPELSDLAPTNVATPLAQIRTEVSGQSANVYGECITDTSAQISARADAASTTFRLAVLGWRDRRGQDDYT